MSASFTLINTFYLKEIWNEYGDELKLTDEKYDFTNVDGSKTRLPLLTGYYSEGNIYKGEGFSSFFTETEHGFKIKFILPDDNYSIDEVFTEENIYKINNLSDYGYIDEENKLLHHTRVLFPEYKADFDGSVTDTLKDDFGIKSLFSMGDCDFSGITDISSSSSISSSAYMGLIMAIITQKHSNIHRILRIFSFFSFFSFFIGFPPQGQASSVL